MPNETAIIRHTKNWLLNVIIGRGLCPFAKREHDVGSIHYSVVHEIGLEGQLESLLAQCETLDKKAAVQTSLLIFPKALDDIEDYLDMVHMGGQLLKMQGYAGIYQLASFHPNYRFKSAGDDDPSNYTNRSPYPMVHILREASVEAALKSYPYPEKIPERNMMLTRQMGLAAMQDLLAQCFQ